MKLLLLTLLMVYLCAVSMARHIHPHGVHIAHMVEDEHVGKPSEDDYNDYAAIRHVKPTRFVPLNNALYFKNFEPCEDGYVRDLLGVCRELWD